MKRIIKQILAIGLITLFSVQSVFASLEHRTRYGEWCREDPQTGFPICSQHSMWEFTSIQAPVEPPDIEREVDTADRERRLPGER